MYYNDFPMKDISYDMKYREEYPIHNRLFKVSRLYLLP